MDILVKSRNLPIQKVTAQQVSYSYKDIEKILQILAQEIIRLKLNQTKFSKSPLNFEKIQAFESHYKKLTELTEANKRISKENLMKLAKEIVETANINRDGNSGKYIWKIILSILFESSVKCVPTISTFNFSKEFSNASNGVDRIMKDAIVQGTPVYKML